MNHKSKTQGSEKRPREIRRSQPRATYKEAMSQHQRMMKATPKGSSETQYATVLEIPPVDSAETPVKIAIFVQAK